MKLFSKFNLAVALLLIGLVAPAGAGVVQFTGKFRAGFGNSWNISNPALGVSPSNNGLPVCAVTNPFALQTWGTLYAQGYAEQGTGTQPTSQKLLEGTGRSAASGRGRRSGRGPPSPWHPGTGCPPAGSSP